MWFNYEFVKIHWYNKNGTSKSNFKGNFFPCGRSDGDFFFSHNTFTLCLVGWNLGMVENERRKMEWKTEFSSVWEWEENRGSGKPRRKFSLPGPQIFSFQIGRKSNERKLPQCIFTVMSSHKCPLESSLKKKKKKQRESAGEWELRLLVLEARNILEWGRQSK